MNRQNELAAAWASAKAVARDTEADVWNAAEATARAPAWDAARAAHEKEMQRILAALQGEQA